MKSENTENKNMGITRCVPYMLKLSPIVRRVLNIFSIIKYIELSHEFICSIANAIHLIHQVLTSLTALMNIRLFTIYNNCYECLTTQLFQIITYIDLFCKLYIFCSRLFVQKFSIFHINIRSSKQNLLQLKNSLVRLNNDCSIIGLSETWGKSINIDLQTISGYNHDHCTRAKYRSGGGTVLLSVVVH